jgi:hypothetical protein
VRGRGAQVGLADRAQPQLDPQDPVALLDAGNRQALLDHVAQALHRRRLAGVECAGVAGELERVLERLGQQRLAGGEVVVHEGRRDAGVHGDAGDPHAVDPVAGDPLDRRVQDPLAAHRR